MIPWEEENASMQILSSLLRGFHRIGSIVDSEDNPNTHVS